MKTQRCVWALLAAAGLVGTLAVSEANAWGRRGYYGAPSPYYVYPSWGYDYNPYVLPLPAYGILPPGYYDRDVSGFRTAADYGYTHDPSATPAKKRAALYPAVPYEPTPAERLADLRRVRFEITVPHADALVTFNGLETKQTGLSRVFVTPPMMEGKEYTVTIDARWKKQDGTLSAPRPRTFTVVGGQTVQHTFIEQ